MPPVTRSQSIKTLPVSLNFIKCPIEPMRAMEPMRAPGAKGQGGAPGAKGQGGAPGAKGQGGAPGAKTGYQ